MSATSARGYLDRQARGARPHHRRLVVDALAILEESAVRAKGRIRMCNTLCRTARRTGKRARIRWTSLTHVIGSLIERRPADSFRVAERSSERRPDGKCGSLQRHGREREPNGVEVLPGDHGEAHRARQAALAGLALGGEGEHRLDQRLEPERRPDLQEEACRLVCGIPEPVGRARWHDELVA